QPRHRAERDPELPAFRSRSIFGVYGGGGPDGDDDDDDDDDGPAGGGAASLFPRDVEYGGGDTRDWPEEECGVLCRLEADGLELSMEDREASDAGGGDDDDDDVEGGGGDDEDVREGDAGEGSLYDDVYFDSEDEEEEEAEESEAVVEEGRGGLGASKTNGEPENGDPRAKAHEERRLDRRRKRTDADMLFDPNSDESDEAWITRKLQGSLRGGKQHWGGGEGGVPRFPSCQGKEKGGGVWFVGPGAADKRESDVYALLPLELAASLFLFACAFDETAPARRTLPPQHRKTQGRGLPCVGGQVFAGDCAAAAHARGGREPVRQPGGGIEEDENRRRGGRRSGAVGDGGVARARRRRGQRGAAAAAAGRRGRLDGRANPGSREERNGGEQKTEAHGRRADVPSLLHLPLLRLSTALDVRRAVPRNVHGELPHGVHRAIRRHGRWRSV
ncbi:MAG: hypothetical protein BJ554DRAFT_2954, partial [Olpidium bornovanus]